MTLLSLSDFKHPFCYSVAEKRCNMAIDKGKGNSIALQRLQLPQ